jgi:uncharacterized membrane protein (UPF0127 family)
MKRGCLQFGTPHLAQFDLEIPETWPEMQRGLVGRDLGSKQGMLFVGHGEAVDMWMSDVNYPLDMVWLGDDGRVKTIQRNVKPGDPKTYRSGGIACVELRGGTARALGIQNGTPWVVFNC